MAQETAHTRPDDEFVHDLDADLHDLEPQPIGQTSDGSTIDPGAPIVDPAHAVLQPLLQAMDRIPHWLPPVNTAAVVAFGWWLSFGLERASGGAHLGSILALVFGTLLTGAAWLLVQALERVAVLDGQLRDIAGNTIVDPLTGMLNRSAITADIEARLTATADDALVGVLFCDLDRLNVINDSLGHQAGDDVVRAAADRLNRALRSVDSVGRFGTGQFVIATSGQRTPRDLEVLADRLVGALAQPTALADDAAQIVSGSVGIAWASQDGPDRRPMKPSEAAVELLRDADSALQLAKKEGGGRYATFDPDARARTVARLELEQDLRRGIRSDELVVHYQPIVDVVTGQAHRYEALVRWDHPVRGMVHPADFLSVASESNLIVELGNRVLHEACRQAVRWTEQAGSPITVSVNLAERQLLDPGLIGSVTRALAESGLPPGQLELEITEELVMERLDRALLVLRQLELAGVGLVIDDFGTSQSSLARLQRLAMVSTLKIDRVFVEGVANESIDRRVVTAIVTQAADLGMTVVAEGVEQSDQADMLAELGVGLQQGFLHQRPGPAEAMIGHSAFPAASLR